MNPNPHQRPPECSEWRGDVRIVVRNRATFCEEVEAPELVAGLVSRLPFEQRQANIAAGRFALPLGGCPECAIIFDVLKYDPETAILTLDYIERRVAIPLYEFWYMPVEVHYSGRNFK